MKEKTDCRMAIVWIAEIKFLLAIGHAVMSFDEKHYSKYMIYGSGDNNYSHS